MMKSMQYLMPVMILVFSLQVPAGLALYWFVSNCIAIGQQYRVNGWGGLRPKEQAASFEKALQEAGYGPGPRSSATGDKIVAKRSSSERTLSMEATTGASAAAVTGAAAAAARNQSRGGGNGNKNTAKSNGGGGAASNGSNGSNGKGTSRPPATVPSGGQRARSQPSGASRRASSKRTRKPK
jgi:60Kd inner membrane protein